MTDNLELWKKLNRPPTYALKTIGGGRLRGMSDINPQWRYWALTEQFGPCGFGWKYTIDELWLEPGSDEEMFAFARVNLYIKIGGEWSDPIPGIGGSKLIQKETGGLHNNDEAYKMAVTDAVSVAFKMLGGAADIYMGLWDGSKYRDVSSGERQKPAGAKPTERQPERPGASVESPLGPTKEPLHDTREQGDPGDEESPFGDEVYKAYPNLEFPPPRTKGISALRACAGYAQLLGWSEEQFTDWHQGLIKGKELAKLTAAQAVWLREKIKKLHKPSKPDAEEPSRSDASLLEEQPLVR